ncbi:MAG: crossover junction endodeoxyribonuclease RuvC [Planctomycetota bacterium]
MTLDGPYTLDDLPAMIGHKHAKSRRFRFDSGKSIITGDSAPLSGLKSSVVTRRASSLRLLGIDPGTRCVGWGLIEYNVRDQSLHLLNCGCIKPSSKLELKGRLCDIFSELETIIRRGRPDVAALEETFAGSNMKSAIAMGEGRGIALLCLARAKLEVLELSPRSIKQAVTGYGAASKQQVAAMVAAQLNLAKPPEPEDVTDALAAAIALSRRTR